MVITLPQGGAQPDQPSNPLIAHSPVLSIKFSPLRAVECAYKLLHLQPYFNNNNNNNNKPEFVHLLQQVYHQVKDGWEKTEPHTGCGLGCDNGEDLSIEFVITKKFKSTAKIFNFAFTVLNSLAISNSTQKPINQAIYFLLIVFHLWAQIKFLFTLLDDKWSWAAADR